MFAIRYTALGLLWMALGGCAAQIRRLRYRPSPGCP